MLNAKLLLKRTVAAILAGCLAAQAAADGKTLPATLPMTLAKEIIVGGLALRPAAPTKPLVTTTPRGVPIELLLRKVHSRRACPSAARHAIRVLAIPGVPRCTRQRPTMLSATDTIEGGIAPDRPATNESREFVDKSPNRIIGGAGVKNYAGQLAAKLEPSRRVVSMSIAGRELQLDLLAPTDLKPGNRSTLIAEEGAQHTCMFKDATLHADTLRCMDEFLASFGFVVKP